MTNLNLIIPSLIVCFLFVVVGENNSCGNREAAKSNPTVTKDRLPAGVWGGEHIRMEVTGSGASLEYDCASSTIDEPVIVDRDGKFDVKGKYSPQHGGPIRRDEETNSPAARYVGHVKDGEMTLTITIADRKEPIGTFNLTQGSEGRVMKCR
jgi:hypothetical protein